MENNITGIFRAGKVHWILISIASLIVAAMVTRPNPEDMTDPYLYEITKTIIPIASAIGGALGLVFWSLVLYAAAYYFFTLIGKKLNQKQGEITHIVTWVIAASANLIIFFLK
jgi:hypothetical protein